MADRFPADLAHAQELLRGAGGGNKRGAWLKAAKCEDYADTLVQVKGIKCIDDLDPLLDESDTSIYVGMTGLIRGKFGFIGLKKKAHLKKLLDGIRAIKL